MATPSVLALTRGPLSMEYYTIQLCLNSEASTTPDSDICAVQNKASGRFCHVPLILLPTVYHFCTHSHVCFPQMKCHHAKCHNVYTTSFFIYVLKWELFNICIEKYVPVDVLNVPILNYWLWKSARLLVGLSTIFARCQLLTANPNNRWEETLSELPLSHLSYIL